MKERPILFNGDMVNAILSGNKTQTRRIVKDFVDLTPYDVCPHGDESEICAWCEMGIKEVCPYGKVGQYLWVRETFTLTQFDKSVYKAGCRDSTGQIWSSVKADPDGVKWESAKKMARKYSRIQLEITDIRVERLNDISEEDAKAEGVSMSAYEAHCWQNYLMPNRAIWALCTPEKSFKSLWESISGKGSWDLNPWVWVVEFKRID